MSTLDDEKAAENQLVAELESEYTSNGRNVFRVMARQIIELRDANTDLRERITDLADLAELRVGSLEDRVHSLEARCRG